MARGKLIVDYDGRDHLARQLHDPGRLGVGALGVARRILLRRYEIDVPIKGQLSKTGESAIEACPGSRVFRAGDPGFNRQELLHPVQPSARKVSSHDEQVDIRLVSGSAAADGAEHRAGDQPGTVVLLHFDEQLVGASTRA